METTHTLDSPPNTKVDPYQDPAYNQPPAISEIDGDEHAEDVEAGADAISQIDDELRGTIPASDPPSWTLGISSHHDFSSSELLKQQSTLDARNEKAGV